MLVISVGCGLYLVTETVRYRDNIATLETELVMSSLLPPLSSYSYSSSSSRAAVVKAGGGGGGAGEERDDSLATIARYLDATYGYGCMDSMSGRVLTSIMPAVVNRNIGNGGGGGRGGGSRFDNTTTVPSIDSLKQEEQLYRNTYIDSNFVRNLEDDLITASSCSYLSNRTLSLLSEAGKGSKSMSFESNKSDPKKFGLLRLTVVPSVAPKVSTVLGDISIFFQNDYDDGSTVGDE
jgi:hypothetical protein